MVGHLIAFMLYSARSKIELLLATVRSARSFTSHRDPETGAHLERMAHYSRLIARELATEFGFDDDYVEHIFLFSPLHDIGKLTIPDRILLKPGKLDEREYAEMKNHTANGRDIIDRLLENYGLEGIEHVEMMRNIAMYHHEAIDGSGYPEQLSQADIPVEARIVTVADVFDALTSERPYKKSWSNEEAFAKLREMSGSKLDARCVEALVSNVVEIEQIQKLFNENRFG
jgi:HD-GYP domain-containing protein (c-di-GMP phosphodiesterase class II)